MRFIALLAGALALNAGAFVTRPTPLNAGAFLTRRPVRRMAPRASAAAAGAPLLTKGHGGASTTVSVEIAEGKTITFETGVMGKQANGAVMTTCGGTIVYSTACATEDPGDFDFCPLRVDYQERFSAAGLTKGGFIKRDGRPSDDEVRPHAVRGPALLCVAYLLHCPHSDPRLPPDRPAASAHDRRGLDTRHAAAVVGPFLRPEDGPEPAIRVRVRCRSSGLRHPTRKAGRGGAAWYAPRHARLHREPDPRGVRCVAAQHDASRHRRGGAHD
mmetsp:Transcript_10460/g.27706  ORF Transcript_10460/g.27706 Transcript_10460/m.27706 type:complete len:272 (+) Transcript_10460:110-925(+)